MICYKFKYKGEDAPAQMITTPCSTNLYLGIVRADGESASLTDGETTYSGVGYSGDCLCFAVTSPTIPETKEYIATITGTVDETPYTHTIHIKVNANAISYGVFDLV